MWDAVKFQSAISTQQDLYLERLRRLVEMESPSGDKVRVDRLGKVISDDWLELGLIVEMQSQMESGNQIKIRWEPAGVDPCLKPWLVVGHFDTVWPVGALLEMPFRKESHLLYGPGTYDMKADLVMAWLTVAEMQKRAITPSRPVVFLWTSDEETGSHSSRELIERQAKLAYAALVLEPPMAGGALKTARKGVGSYRVEARGRSAHAGVEPERGRSAILELAHQVIQIQSMAAAELGTTINVGQIGGGSANNVVPERAWAEVDVRVATLEEALRIDCNMQALTPVTPDVSLIISGGLNRPPMVRTRATEDLFMEARRIADRLGQSLMEGATGGGSDGNFTSAVGCPTLDGLGLEGAGAHAPHEQIDLRSLPFRATLLAGLLSSELDINPEERP
ncbi:MAG: M20 family metallopeptidase [Planctomycetota bacterium]